VNRGVKIGSQTRRRNENIKRQQTGNTENANAFYGEFVICTFSASRLMFAWMPSYLK
jgi:hypothetical protein